MNKKPLIIVTGPKKIFRLGGWATRLALLDNRVAIKYVSKRNRLPNKKIHGVIIGGGDDIDPQYYGNATDHRGDYDFDRDILELDIIRMAKKSGIPILGLCRGAHLINISCKGTLFQDIRPLRRNTKNRYAIRPRKRITIQEGSLLSQIISDTSLNVNQLHHQAIKRLGDNLEATATDADGFIQAIENRGKQWIFGVQWHPEYLFYRPEHRSIFSAFCNEVYRSSHYMIPEQIEI